MTLFLLRAENKPKLVPLVKSRLRDLNEARESAQRFDMLPLRRCGWQLTFYERRLMLQVESLSRRSTFPPPPTEGLSGRDPLATLLSSAFPPTPASARRTCSAAAVRRRAQRRQRPHLGAAALRLRLPLTPCARVRLRPALGRLPARPPPELGRAARSGGRTRRPPVLRRSAPVRRVALGAAAATARRAGPLPVLRRSGPPGRPPAARRGDGASHRGGAEGTGRMKRR